MISLERVARLFSTIRNAVSEDVYIKFSSSGERERACHFLLDNKISYCEIGFRTMGTFSYGEKKLRKKGFHYELDDEVRKSIINCPGFYARQIILH